jgi:uncharacterized protein with NRDE domain
MCLMAFAIDPRRRFAWVIASNRDEFLDRPTSPLAWWHHGQTEILSGRDLTAGGTWFGLTRSGRMALVTNVREPGRFDAAAPSRGTLVIDALAGAADDADWVKSATETPRNGFNLIVADLRGNTGQWLTNRPARSLQFSGGVHGLSNAALDTPWPKVERLKNQLGDWVAKAADADELARLAFAGLADRQIADDSMLPSTGVPLERERLLSAAFIRIPANDAGTGLPAVSAPVYGTRCSSLLIVERAASGSTVHMIERRYDADGRISGETTERFAIPALDPA